MPNRTVTCGDCIHADICKQLNGGWFSSKNIAYCKGFKDRTKFVEVVRCKDCKHWNRETISCEMNSYLGARERPCWYADDFRSYGERKDNGCM